MSAKKLLLINPSFESVYKNVKIKEGVPYSPVLSLACISAPVLEAGHDVKILDLNVEIDKEAVLSNYLSDFCPEYVGITFTTALFNEAQKIAKIVKSFDKNIILLAGGAHVSSFPEETLKMTVFDIVAVGEGDFTLKEIINGQPLESIQGISYKRNGELCSNPRKEYIKDLDILPFPSWPLYNLKRYKTTELLAVANPAGWLETSRGCVYGCVYCNKNVFGRTFRVKSPKRTVAEIAYMLKSGFKEIHLADDNFTTNIARAKEICNLILAEGLKFPWATVTGIRADCVDGELLNLMKKAGCYRVYYGIESGNQDVLNKIHKGLKINQVYKAVELAKNAGLEVFGFFMMGLPGETEKELQDTIRLAKSLDLDMAKASITIPLPGTPLFNEWNEKKLIKTDDWSKFNLYTIAREVYDHPELDWDTIEKYYNKFYRDFYFRPSFIAKRFIKDIKTHRLSADIKYFFKTKW